MLGWYGEEKQSKRKETKLSMSAPHYPQGGNHPTQRTKDNPAGTGIHFPLHFIVTYTFQDRLLSMFLPMFSGAYAGVGEWWGRKHISEVIKSGNRNANSYPTQCHPRHSAADWKLLENKVPVIPLQHVDGYPPDTQLALSNDASESSCFSYQHLLFPLSP